MMGRTPNHEHVTKTLRVLAILRSEPGYHQIARLAEIVGTKPKRLADDLRRCCYAAEGWHLPLVFGGDTEPPHPKGDAMVQLLSETPVQLPLPSSRVDLIRLSLLADQAARRDPDTPVAETLIALHHRLMALLDADDIAVSAAEPPASSALRTAIGAGRRVTFGYRSLTDKEPRARTVTPLRIERQGKWWVLQARPDEGSGAQSYRVDRIVGDVADAGPAAESAAGSTDSSPAPTSAVRLRLHVNDLWVTDDMGATDLVQLPDGEHAEVTVNLYPPVGERLSRLLFLADPATTTVLAGTEHLADHQRHVADQLRVLS